MKANELSIGDWVQARMITFQGEERLTPPMRVVAIGETWVRLQIDPEAGDPDEYDIEEIRPVPLTADILLANEWKHRSNFRLRLEIREDNRLRGAVECEEGNYGGFWIDVWASKYSLRLPVSYIHELQHAIRLAGLEKEFDL